MTKSKDKKHENKNEKRGKFIDVLLGVFAAVTLVNYGTYFLHLIFFPESTTAVVIALCVIAITALPILFRKSLKKLFGKTFRFMKTLWGAGLAFYVVTFIIF